MQSNNILTREISTIDKTLLIAKLMDGFWDRWLAHGLVREDLTQVRSSFVTKEAWLKSWSELAAQKMADANNLKLRNDKKGAEIIYRIAGLYYQLTQWLIPENNEEKQQWLHSSLQSFSAADQISGIGTRYETIEVNDKTCYGRIRIPSDPKGVVIIINPLDSAKEELFTYEMDFVDSGFITVSFDGPGQGQTFTDEGFKATKDDWKQFVDNVINYAHSSFTGLPIHLFGTSSGASWAIYGSCNAKVSKTVSVSPAFLDDSIRLPDYFLERTSYVLEKGEIGLLPSFENLTFRNPVYLIHGKKDVMVPDSKIYGLFDQLPVEKTLIEYEDEGHCCNYKLPEIRQKAAGWFDNKGENNEL
ncbi:alpha/beta hydrolase [Bacillus sp. CECT 9360]|uniref:alpha/beta hydrolase n=1 Tax=Bacillus sp. CECT 9360 TaxID=2845821 RepID=UPI001E48B772|nr:alpha/beta hydrolase [Bacillus sp. CECT 9360]CAH0346421.1 2,6-dihydropseudooxynicotine hydrolase [Bacillus sp. CECT 9360]